MRKVCFLASRPRVLDNRRVHNSMDKFIILRFPSFHLNSPSPAKNNQRRSGRDSRGTFLAYATVVSLIQCASFRLNYYAGTTSLTSSFYFQRPTSAGIIAYPGGRQVIRQAFTRSGVSEGAAEIMLSSITLGTLKQYEKPLKSWWSFCATKNLSLYEADTAAILEFFTIEMGNISYSTLNIYRAAISLIMGNKLGKDPEVSRFFRGVANQKPKKPKYTSTWNPDVVLNLLETWWPLSSINLEKLTKKLVALLALCTAQRVQTLAKIKINNISETEGGVKIFITDRIKTTNIRNQPPILELPHFQEKEKICPVKTLQEYIKRTTDLRPQDEETLLLTFKKPHHAATTQSISRWIKHTLEESGVDTKKFTAHSTRHASTSAAARGGVSIETIKKAAGWSMSSTTFFRFYNRPLQEESFASSIINKK